MRKSYKQRQKAGFIYRVWIILAITAASLYFIDAQFRPIVKTMAAYQAKVYATEAINGAVIECLDRWNAAGNKIVTVSYNGSGEVSTIQTDAVALNTLKAEITKTVSAEISRLEQQRLSVPIGTLLGSHVFSGRGPGVEFKIVPAGYVKTDIVNRFDAAGINQTRHQIYIDISANIVAILPGYTSATEVATNICVAETVVIGQVPGTFAEFSTGGNGLGLTVPDSGGNFISSQSIEGMPNG